MKQGTEGAKLAEEGEGEEKAARVERAEGREQRAPRKCREHR